MGGQPLPSPTSVAPVADDDPEELLAELNRLCEWWREHPADVDAARKIADICVRCQDHPEIAEDVKLTTTLTTGSAFGAKAALFTLAAAMAGVLDDPHLSQRRKLDDLTALASESYSQWESTNEALIEFVRGTRGIYLADPEIVKGLLPDDPEYT